MYFDETKKELKRIPLFPVLSYCSTMILLGFLLKEISNLGSLSYFITFIFLLLLGASVDWFTEGNILNALRKDWVALPFYAHLLIIIDCLIIFNLIKTITSKELWIKKILNR